MQNPVSEDMAAFPVTRQLHLINGEALNRPVQRHRLYRAAEPARLGRDDFFLTRDQRNPGRPDTGHHPIIIFPRQKPERKADQAGLMAEQPLYRIMGFASVGRAEQNSDLGRGHGGDRTGWQNRKKAELDLVRTGFSRNSNYQAKTMPQASRPGKREMGIRIRGLRIRRRGAAEHRKISRPSKQICK